MTKKSSKKVVQGKQFKLPGTFVAPRSKRAIDVVRCQAMASENLYCGGEVIVVKLSRTRWTVLKDSRIENVDGCVGGYNRLAPEVALLLADLRFWSKAKAEAFCDWFDKQEKLMERNSDKARLEELAKKLGYEVAKKSSSKKVDEDGSED